MFTATELVHELRDVEVVWCVKDDSISAAFVDAGAGQFFLDEISQDKLNAKVKEPRVKRLKYTGGIQGEGEDANVMGGALGPDWHRGTYTH